MSRVLPSWQYADPASVAERVEATERNRQAKAEQRRAEFEADLAAIRHRRDTDGLSPQTAMQLRRLHIREVMAKGRK